MNLQLLESSPKILILLPRQLGDVLTGTPLASALKKKYPTSEIHWWAHPMAKAILEGNPYLSKIFYYPVWDKKKYQKETISKIRLFILWFKFIFSSVCFVFQVRKEKYDVVLDSMNYPRSTLQTALTGARVRISFSTRFFRNLFYTHLISRKEMDAGYLGHTRLKLLAPLGIHFTCEDLLSVKTDLPINQTDKIKPDLWLKENFSSLNTRYDAIFNKFLCKARRSAIKRGSGTQVTQQQRTRVYWKPRYCTVSPTHKHDNHRWPAKNYVQLALLLVKKYNIAIVWLRGPNEEDFILSLHHELKIQLKNENLNENMSLLPPLFSLKESAYLATLACGWVGNSNGMSHAAVAAGAKTLEIHGPSKPQNWTSPGRKRNQYVQRTTGCIACTNKFCKLDRMECLEDISVNFVFEKIESFFFKNTLGGRSLRFVAVSLVYRFRRNEHIAYGA